LPLTLGPSNQLLGLAGGGVYPAGIVTDAAVRSYRTISPLPVNRQIGTIGCVFSAALSRGSPRVAVSHHRALSCSDFPPVSKETSDRPTHSFRSIILPPAAGDYTMNHVQVELLNFSIIIVCIFLVTCERSCPSVSR